MALEKTKLMSWTVSEIEEIANRRPKLAVALLQLLVQRSVDFGARIESFSVDNIARRLARLLACGFRTGWARWQTDGSVQMIPFTHELLSQCTWEPSLREIVTHYMNHFRRQGFLRYSRKGILLHRESLGKWLRHEDSAGRRGLVNNRVSLVITNQGRSFSSMRGSTGLVRSGRVSVFRAGFSGLGFQAWDSGRMRITVMLSGLPAS